jgi:hypothetical protein
VPSNQATRSASTLWSDFWFFRARFLSFDSFRAPVPWILPLLRTQVSDKFFWLRRQQFSESMSGAPLFILLLGAILSE